MVHRRLKEIPVSQRYFLNSNLDEFINGSIPDAAITDILLTDEAAKYASREIALNLDNEMVKAFDDFLEYVPAARGLFLFPRTGVNSATLAWTFNPMSSVFNVQLPKVKRTLRATTKAEKLDVLRNHGIEIADGLKLEEAFSSPSSSLSLKLLILGVK